MFGSVDDPGVLEELDTAGLEYRIHVDAAYGGLIYPLTTSEHCLSFRDPRVHSMTMDAHKILQAPYGTGIFLARKGLMDLVRTSQATYVPGAGFCSVAVGPAPMQWRRG